MSATNPPAVATTEEDPFVPYQILDRPIYHMCVQSEWEAACSLGQAYFPPTFQADSHVTHASMHKHVLLTAANLFYKDSNVSDKWICLEINPNVLLHQLGIVTLVEAPRAVGDQEAESPSTIRYPHIYGGIATSIPGLVTNTYPMTRNEQDGTFVSIPGLVDDDANY